MNKCKSRQVKERILSIQQEPSIVHKTEQIVEQKMFTIYAQNVPHIHYYTTILISNQSAKYGLSLCLICYSLPQVQENPPKSTMALQPRSQL